MKKKPTTSNQYMGAVQALTVAFNYFNKELFNGNLSMPNLTIQSAGRKNALGWFWPGKWTTEDGEVADEISISAECLGDRTVDGVLETLIHEMIHAHNHSQGIKDCNDVQYHNKKFKVACEAVGLVVTKHKSRGWAITALGEELKAKVEAYIADKKLKFKINRRVQTKEYKKMYNIGCTEEDKERSVLLGMRYENNKAMVEAALDLLEAKHEADDEREAKMRAMQADAESEVAEVEAKELIEA